jgi:hypothetical protein
LIPLSFSPGTEKGVTGNSGNKARTERLAAQGRKSCCGRVGGVVLSRPQPFAALRPCCGGVVAVDGPGRQRRRSAFIRACAARERPALAELERARVLGFNTGKGTHHMRTTRTEALINSAERLLHRLKHHGELDALTKLNRALGEQRVFRDMDGRERIIGWNERKRDRPKCGARTRAGGSCRAPVVRGKSRCRMHGGLSTGPRTAEGKARSFAARRAGHQRWVAERAAAKHTEAK